MPERERVAMATRRPRTQMHWLLFLKVTSMQPSRLCCASSGEAKRWGSPWPGKT